MSLKIKTNLILIAQGILMIWITVAPYIEHGSFDFSLYPFKFYKTLGLIFNIMGAG